MRKQLRTAAFLFAALTAVAPPASGLFTSPVGAQNEDRTDSPEYTESRADYWEARAAYAARKAATQARKEAGLSEEEAAALGIGILTAPAAEAEAYAPQAASRYVEGYPTNAQLAALRVCESGDDYTINTGNGYYGAYQFSAITWWWLGYTGYPHHASPAVQDEAARYLYSIFGWTPWPACSWLLGFA